jgi:transcriptional regulator NrdR family protein
MYKLKIIKKDGSIEEFDPKKIFYSCLSAGASEEVAKKVVDWIITDLHHVESKMIRRKVLEKLRDLDKEVANNWIKYDIQQVM